MKPDWDQLMEEFKGSPSALVADVDCTAGGKELCDKVGVKGYPTIKWGDPNDLQEYQGGRDLKALQAFAEENLGPTCGPENLELCDEEARATIEKFLAMGAEELNQAILAVEEKVQKIEDKAQKEVDKLSAQLQDLHDKMAVKNQQKDDLVAKESKKIGLKSMKAVLKAKQKQADEGKKTKKRKGSKKKKKDEM